MISGRELKELRLKAGLTQENVGKYLGVGKQAIHKYEAEIITNIPSDSIEKLAKLYHVSPAYLMGWSTNLSNIPESSTDELRHLPVVSKVSCESGALAYDEILGYEPTPKSWLNDGEYFYTYASGDSMINVRIYDGDLVLIRKQADVDDGEIAAIVVDNKIFLKRIYKRNGSMILQSENPAYPPKMVKNGDTYNCCIIGKLKKAIIKY
jgi:SOS-response transcriptional repressors (RecA-mediated autopeptidases)